MENTKENNNSSKTVNKNRTKIMIALAAAILVVAIGLGIYNSPENRLNRQLDLGQKYLSEQNYEEAIVAFNQAIEIDDKCMEAYAGGVEASLQSGDRESLQFFCEKAIEAMKSMNADELEQNMEHIQVVYRAVDEAYEDMEAVNVLAEGVEMTAELENAQGIKTLLGEALEEYLKVLYEEKDYDKLESVLLQYRDNLPENSVEEWEVKIAERKKAEASKKDFLSKLYEYAEAGDTWAILNQEFYKEGIELLNISDEEHYIYIPEDEKQMNGMGVGLYQYGEELENGQRLFYLYYGNYNNRIREGIGTSYCYVGEGAAYLFVGNWAKDVPNGEGIQVGYGASANTIMEGNLANGLWHGEISIACYDYDYGDYLYETNFSAANGIPTEDLSEEYRKLYDKHNPPLVGGGVIGSTGVSGYGTEKPWYNEEDNEYCYAYVYDKENELYNQYVAVKNQTMGAIGFSESIEREQAELWYYW